MSTEQAFFAAYGQPVSTVPGRGDPAKATQRATQQVDRQRTGPAIDTQYSDGSWYRVDSRHTEQESPPTPHLERAVQPRVQPAARAGTTEVTTSTLAAEWQSSCLVMASQMPETAAPILAASPNAAAVIMDRELLESAGHEIEHDTALPESIKPIASAAEAAIDSEPSRPLPSNPKPGRSAPERRVCEPGQPQSSAPVPSASGQPVGNSAAVQAFSGLSEQHSSASQEPSNPSVSHWAAQWEVDEFAWPDELLRLQDEQAEYFRYAGEKLRDASREGLKTLAVVGTRGKEGATTMAICLARAAAAAGARVALLDANLDHPELGPKLGLDFSHGWQESLGGQSSLSEAAVMAVDSGLTLFPLSASHRLSSLTDPRISAALAEIAVVYDLVIVDAGVAPAGDAALFEAGERCPVAAALVVRDLRRTSETETLVTASRLKLLGVDAVGIAENFTPRPGNQSAA